MLISNRNKSIFTNQHIIVASHRRSGTHLTIDAITHNFKVYSQTETSKTTLDHLSTHVETKTTKLDDLCARLGRCPHVLKTHSHGKPEDFFIGSSEVSELIDGLFERSKIIYIHRDGRDVLTSLYYYVQSYNQKFEEISFSEFIKMNNDFDFATYSCDYDRISYWLYHIETWLLRKDMLALSFDDFLFDYENTIQRISQFIGQPLPKKIDNVVRDKAGIPIVERMRRKLHLGKRFSSVNFRKGKSGDWMNCFLEEDIEYFEAKAGRLNKTLGYS